MLAGSDTGARSTHPMRVCLEASAAAYEADRQRRAALVAEVQAVIDEVRASHG